MTDEDLQTMSNLNSVMTPDYSLIVVLVAVVALIVAAVLLRSTLPIVPEYKYTDS